MGRLIEIQPLTQAVPPVLTVAVGDVLKFAASGGLVREGTSVESLGAFLESVVGTDGNVIAPMGAPNAILFRARSAGRTAIEVVVGDPWQSPGTVHLTVVVAQCAPGPKQGE